LPDPGNPMRNAETINLFFFSFFVLAAWLRKMEPRNRLWIAAVGLGGITVSTGLYATQSIFPPYWSQLLRDWAPAPLLLTVYWQAPGGGACM